MEPLDMGDLADISDMMIRVGYLTERYNNRASDIDLSFNNPDCFECQSPI